jgi:hypothetical protein
MKKLFFMLFLIAAASVLSGSTVTLQISSKKTDFSGMVRMSFIGRDSPCFDGFYYSGFLKKCKSYFAKMSKLKYNGAKMKDVLPQKTKKMKKSKKVRKKFSFCSCIAKNFHL